MPANAATTFCGKNAMAMVPVRDRLLTFTLSSGGGGGGDNDFAYYGDVVAAYSNNEFIPELSGTTRGAMAPRAVHVYFKDIGAEKLEYEGVNLLVPKCVNGVRVSAAILC